MRKYAMCCFINPVETRDKFVAHNLLNFDNQIQSRMQYSCICIYNVLFNRALVITFYLVKKSMWQCG